MGWDVTFRAFLSLVLVFGLIIGAGLLAKRIAARGGLLARKGGRRRLAVIETLMIDNRRRLVLVRRDGTEHLLLVGGGTDLLIERAEAHPPFTLDPPGEPV
jgi:flagellar protein FliO/FliZ